MIKYLKSVNYHELFLVAVGTAILAFGYGLFIIPNNIVAGGMSGLAVVINSVFHLESISLVVTCIAWSFFLLGLIVLGKKFALRTLVSTLVFPLIIFICEHLDYINAEIAKIDQLWVICILGAICEGFGLALVFKLEGTTGGVDILAFIIKKFVKVQIYQITFLIDFSIIIAGIFAVGLTQGLIGVVYIILANIALRRFFSESTGLFLVRIISSQQEKILDFIHLELERGSTLLYAQGGYTKQEKMVIEVLISKDQFASLKQFVTKNDPEAFIYILPSGQAIGNGFS